jgi:hypothetical protein
MKNGDIEQGTLSDIELDSDQDIEDEEVWHALSRSKGFDSQMLGEPDDEIPDGLDDVSDISSLASDDDQENGLESDGEMDRWAGIHEEDEEFLDNFQEEYSDEGSFAGLLSDEEQQIDDTVMSKRKEKSLNRIAERANKLGYHGSYFESKSSTGDFATAEEFESLLNQDSSSDSVPQEAKKRSKSELSRKTKRQRK